jgi:hypothetical protein
VVEVVTMVEGAPPAEADPAAPAVRPLRPTNRRFFCVAVGAAAESSDDDDDAVTTSATEAEVDVARQHGPPSEHVFSASPKCTVVLLFVVLSCSISLFLFNFLFCFVLFFFCFVFCFVLFCFVLFCFGLRCRPSRWRGM